MPVVSSIRLYPVKSCGGIEVPRWELDRHGLRYDRSWMIVDQRGRFLTQRELPRMALISAALSTDALTLSTPDLSPLAVPIEGVTGAEVPVEIWEHHGMAIDQGDRPATWLSAFLGVTVRLVRMPPHFERPVKLDHPAPAAVTSFTDGYPLLLLSEASVEDLSRRVGMPLPLERFRPSLVVRGCAPYAEDQWDRIRIGAAEFARAQPCARCSITTIDQKTTVAGKEPLATLAGYRRGGDGVLFGVYLIHRGPGSVEVGTEIEVLSGLGAE